MTSSKIQQSLNLIADPEDEAVQSHLKALQNELEELHDEGYLFQPEIYSEDECVKLANSLNAKIQQISASLVRACCGSPGNLSSMSKSKISADDLLQIQTIRPLIGKLAVEFFLDSPSSQHTGSSDNRKYMYIIRCAIQTTLAALCGEIINAWSFNKEENKMLSSIYNSLRNQFDNSALTGTWRSLTRSQSKIPEYHHLKPAAIRSYIAETAKVLVLSGYISWNLDDTQGIIQEYFEEEFADLYNYCFRLDRVTGESIQAFDTEVYRPEPGEAYEHASMYNMDSSTKSSNSSSSTTKIAFSCRLGLLKIGTIKPENGGSEPEDEILLKAGIQFASLLSDFETAIP
ncbi:hypothetical protein DFH05DRAFT_1524654 [Lentinula detonsa]|uniref:Uncharacterized protein n=1 Tax=Lentinula detonsa TaxID=2804962 RepID=A0A9W8P1I0_9AGAR|nr:hypothetical protein DFH05DRAFT_1524654 [Lentinula detonsa]